jgi:hypothetical protein
LVETQAAKQRLEAVLQSINDSFIALDRDWRYTARITRAYSIFMGAPQGGMTVRPTGWPSRILRASVGRHEWR